MIFHFKFTIEELQALKRILEHHYISYEDMGAIEVTRKIVRIVEQYELSAGDSKAT